MHKLFFLFAAFSFVACYSVSKYQEGVSGESHGISSVKTADPWQTLEKPYLSVYPPAVTPGEYCTVFLVPPQTQESGAGAPLKATLYTAAGKKIAAGTFFQYTLDDAGHSVRAALITPPSTTDPTNALIKIESQGAVIGEVPLRILARDFAAETIDLNAGNTSIRTKPDPQKTAESEYLWSILAKTGGDIWTTEPFITPVPPETRRSSFFGDRRIYRYSTGSKDTSVHAGIDYAVPRGTPVKACARGKILLARPRIVTGNSVIIEHAPGVYSLYYHLDVLKSSEGTMVNAGDVIGLSGSTGLSTGPHLHWEIRVSTENTDPDVFTKRPLLDRNAIIASVFNNAPLAEAPQKASKPHKSAPRRMGFKTSAR